MCSRITDHPVKKMEKLKIQLEKCISKRVQFLINSAKIGSRN